MQCKKGNSDCYIEVFSDSFISSTGAGKNVTTFPAWVEGPRSDTVPGQVDAARRETPAARPDAPSDTAGRSGFTTQRKQEALMAQVFDRSSNALARASLVLTGLIVIALGVGLNSLQRSPVGDAAGPAAGPAGAVQPQAPRGRAGAAVPVLPHVRWRRRAYAGIPPTKTCINCHAQIWTNAALLEPVRHSWATGQSINWIRVHDLPDYVYFNHEIHVNKGIGCASCHGRVDEMPLMYQENSLQMEWCLNCHRNPEQEPAADERDLQHGVGRVRRRTSRCGVPSCRARM